MFKAPQFLPKSFGSKKSATSIGNVAIPIPNPKPVIMVMIYKSLMLVMMRRKSEEIWRNMRPKRRYEIRGRSFRSESGPTRKRPRKEVKDRRETWEVWYPWIVRDARG